MKVKEGNGVNQANANQEKADTFKLPLEKQIKAYIKIKVIHGNKQGSPHTKRFDLPRRC